LLALRDVASQDIPALTAIVPIVLRARVGEFLERRA
jgi:hypothetical protein